MNGWTGTKLGVLLLGLLSMVGCSGSGDQLAGIEGTGGTVSVTASGSITGFGSVYVNGVRYPTDNAEITIEGQTATEAQLAPGMVVTIDATRRGEELDIQSIAYEPLLRGTITAVETLDAARKQLRVLGQVVLVSEDAIFSGLSYDELVAGLSISVSGFSNQEGGYLASRIARSSGSEGSSTRLTGAITSVDKTQARLTVGNLVVDYENAVFSAAQAEDLAIGATVTLVGEMTDAGHMRASQIRLSASQDAASSTQASIEGLVSEYDSQRAFTLNGVRVDASTASFNRGSASLVSSGARVAVDGSINTSGALVATRVTLLLPSESRVRGPVETVDGNGSKLRLFAGEFETDAFTVYEDQSAEGNRFINMRGLNSGEVVEVHGRNINGRWVATHITRKDASTGVVLKGVVGRMEGSMITVMGVDVDLSGIDAELLGELHVGSSVTVVGTTLGSKAMLATQLEVHAHPACAAPVAVGCGASSPAPGRR